MAYRYPAYDLARILLPQSWVGESAFEWALGAARFGKGSQGRHRLSTNPS
jgi:hypothetical protein